MVSAGNRLACRAIGMAKHLHPVGLQYDSDGRHDSTSGTRFRGGDTDPRRDLAQARRMGVSAWRITITES